MNKTEIVSLVAEKTTYTKKATEEILDAVLELIQETLEKGEKVVLSGFGTFEVRSRVARKGRDPRDGSTISIPKQKTPAFKAGKVLKEAIR